MTNTNSNIMKKSIIPLALLAVLSLATTGCQKGNKFILLRPARSKVCRRAGA